MSEERKLQFFKTDGGRSQYFKGRTGDCGTRAIALATNMDYGDVYADLTVMMREMTGGLDRSPRDGLCHAVLHRFMTQQGWQLYRYTTPTYFNARNVPMDETVLCVLSRHYATVIAGTVNDTWDSRWDGKTKHGVPKLLGYYA